MDQKEIIKFLNKLGRSADRNIVIVDFANVDKWEKSLGWPIGLKKLGQLVKHISQGKKFLRRFYYGEDYGPKDKSTKLSKWSARILNDAKMSGFEVISKRVKYIPNQDYASGYVMKCNLDIEMAIDLIKEKNNYDKAIIFSGDGDLACVAKLLVEDFGKEVFFFGARDHVGKELIDARSAKMISEILFVEDFEYRLNLKRNP